MVMVSPALNPVACWEFEGEILVLHHPTTISSRYQAMGNSEHFLFLVKKCFYKKIKKNVILSKTGVPNEQLIYVKPRLRQEE